MRKGSCTHRHSKLQGLWRNDGEPFRGILGRVDQDGECAEELGQHEGVEDEPRTRGGVACPATTVLVRSALLPGLFVPQECPETVDEGDDEELGGDVDEPCLGLWGSVLVVLEGGVRVERVVVVVGLWCRDFGNSARFLDAQAPVADEFGHGGGCGLALSVQSAFAYVVHETRDELCVFCCSCCDVFAVQRSRKHLAREPCFFRRYA